MHGIRIICKYFSCGVFKSFYLPPRKDICYYQTKCRLHSRGVDSSWEKYLCLSRDCDPESRHCLTKQMTVIEDFINEDDEKALCDEVEPYMKKLRYESGHWDNAIHRYRETERLKWNETNTELLQLVQRLAFPSGTNPIKFIHVLDLAEDGVIKPHIDSVRFCGNTIAGLSLLSHCVMRLTHEKHPNMYGDFLLRRRSLYIMKNSARYDYTHEVLHNDASVFRGEPIHKGRRLSVICRNEPPSG